MRQNFIGKKTVIEYVRNKSKDDGEFTIIRNSLNGIPNYVCSYTGTQLVSVEDMHRVLNDSYLLKMMIKIKIYHLDDMDYKKLL